MKGISEQLALNILRTTDNIQRQVPFGRHVFKYVEFSATPGVDVAINRELDPEHYNDVGYVVVQQDAAGSVYQDMSATRRSWTQNAIYLRSDVASLKAVIMLFTPATSMSSLQTNL